jgi:hypothetical protein
VDGQSEGKAGKVCAQLGGPEWHSYCLRSPSISVAKFLDELDHAEGIDTLRLIRKYMKQANKNKQLRKKQRHEMMMAI